MNNRNSAITTEKKIGNCYPLSVVGFPFVREPDITLTRFNVRPLPYSHHTIYP